MKTIFSLGRHRGPPTQGVVFRKLLCSGNIRGVSVTLLLTLPEEYMVTYFVQQDVFHDEAAERFCRPYTNVSASHPLNPHTVKTLDSETSFDVTPSGMRSEFETQRLWIREQVDDRLRPKEVTPVALAVFMRGRNQSYSPKPF